LLAVLRDHLARLRSRHVEAEDAEVVVDPPPPTVETGHELLTEETTFVE
jgi:hypothetical protein